MRKKTPRIRAKAAAKKRPFGEGRLHRREAGERSSHEKESGRGPLLKGRLIFSPMRKRAGRGKGMELPSYGRIDPF